MQIKHHPKASAPIVRKFNKHYHAQCKIEMWRMGTNDRLLLSVWNVLFTHKVMKHFVGQCNTPYGRVQRYNVLLLFYHI